MKCSDIRHHFSDYIDGEALPEIAAAIEAHGEQCPDCRAELAAYRAFVNRFSSLDLEELPFGFNARLHASLEAEAKARAQAKARQRKSRVRIFGLIAACLVLVVGASAVLGNLTGMGRSMKSYDAETIAGIPEAPMAAYDMAGGSSEEYVADGNGASYDMAAPQEAPAPAPEAELYGITAESGVRNSLPAAPEEALARKVIRNSSLFLQVDDFDGAYAAIEATAQAYGGYVVSAEKYHYEGETQQRGYVSIRVDAERLDQALAEIEALGNVESSNIYSNDITAEYYDIQSRLSQYQAQAERLTQLYDKAEEITDLIAIEAELTRVNAEVDSLAGTLRYYDQLTALSLIDVNLYTPNVYTQSVEPKGWAGFWQDLGEDFFQGLNNTLDFLAALVIFLARILPGLVLLAVAVAVIVLVFKARRKRKARQG